LLFENKDFIFLITSINRFSFCVFLSLLKLLIFTRKGIEKNINQTATIGPAIRILADKSFSIPNKGVSVCTNPNNIINRQIIPPAYY